MLLLTFRAAENLYAVDVTRVVEVVPRVELRRLPHAPAYLTGLFDYRGAVVPVIDLAILLGLDPCRDRLSTRIILVDLRPGETHRDGPSSPSRRRLVGLVAEHVSDVASVTPEQVISPPMNLPQAPYLGAIVEVGQEMTQLIIADHLLEPSFREAFFEGGSKGDDTTARGAAASVES
jgi:chemotaxis-related protein WspB